MASLASNMRIATSSRRALSAGLLASASACRPLPTSPILARAISRPLSTVSPTVDPSPPPPKAPEPPKQGQGQNTGSKRSYNPFYILGAFTSIGAFVTIYALVEYYSALPKWPESVRTPLRRALRAKNLGDTDRADGFFQEAIAAALALQPSAFGPDPLLWLSGLYITYAVFLEENRHMSAAYILLRESLTHFGPNALSPEPSKQQSGAWANNQTLTPSDHIRAIGLTQKLGHLALAVATGSKALVYPTNSANGPKTWLDAAETHLGDALTAMLKLGLNAPPVVDGKAGAVVVGRDVDLPVVSHSSEDENVLKGGSVDKTGLGITMEALASIYTEKREYGIAGGLLQQAISTLVPAKKDAEFPIPDQCQVAQLMTTLSNLSYESKNADYAKLSRTWASRAAHNAEQALRRSEGTDANVSGCQLALVMVGLNLGQVEQGEGNIEKARAHYQTALNNSKKIGFRQGVQWAQSALARNVPRPAK